MDIDRRHLKLSDVQQRALAQLQASPGLTIAELRRAIDANPRNHQGFYLGMRSLRARGIVHSRRLSGRVHLYINSRWPGWAALRGE